MAEAADTESMSPSRSRGSDLVNGFNNLNLLRQAGLMVGIAASVAIGFAAVLWSQGEDYRPLYGSLDRLDSAEVGEILDFNSIPYKIDVSTGALLVPADDLHKARLRLAESGIPGNQSTGFELLDKEQPLGTSQFMEATRYRRALEGELARTIMSVNAVRSARVHLAIPKQSVFVRDGREPTASVFLELFPGRGIQSTQIRGIANLVASSIPELKLQNVTVVDQKGNLLSASLEEDKMLAQANRHLEYTREVENGIAMRVQRLLGPIVGMNNFNTEVNADLDFTEIEQAEESYNPDLTALRSEQVVEEKTNAGNVATGVPGALTNQPPAQGVAPEQVEQGQPDGAQAAATAGNSRSQAIRNYELDRTISYTKHEKGRLRRLTVAVVVDNKEVTDPQTGETTRAPWTDAELERLAILVRDAVGYSAARGDSVNILNAPFLETNEPVVLQEEWWQTEWFKSIAKQAAGVLIIALLIIGLLRPVLKSLAKTGASRGQEEESELAALQAAGIDSLDSLSSETVTLTGGDSLALPSPEESYEQQLNAVKGLVAEDAGRVAQVIKRWINEE
jgi:flagellar M-ring protein FliF